MFQLRPFQKEALAALESPTQSPQHVICIAPTGSGKSLIYERLASRERCRTLLITPLVALARQQFARLQKLGIPTFLGAGGGKSSPLIHQSGAWIVSPELLQFASVQHHLTRWGPELMVVDECHCLWEWGDKFRPAFQKVPHTLTLPSIRKSLWLTATLPIEARLQLRTFFSTPPIELGEFDLSPLVFLEIRHSPLTQRLQELMSWLHSQEGTGIIFVSTRDMTLRLARVIAAMGKKTSIYHAGMSKEERQLTERMVHEQQTQIVVATTAFGMGMDYPHLSFVILWQAPTSLLSLVQTIGRVGRNVHTPSRALVFWDFDDFRMLEWTIQNSHKRRNELNDLLIFLKSKNCRRASLRRYFGSTLKPSRCSRCDICAKIAYWPLA